MKIFVNTFFTFFHRSGRPSASGNDKRERRSKEGSGPSPVFDDPGRGPDRMGVSLISTALYALLSKGRCGGLVPTFLSMTRFGDLRPSQ